MLRIFLPVFLATYGVVCFAWRIGVVWRRTGRNPLRLGGSDSVYDFVGRVFALTITAGSVAVLVYAFGPEGYPYLGPLSYLESPVLEQVGAGMLVLSLLLTAEAQRQMRDSWRIGVDHEQRTALVEKGLYRYSRNPIYVGVILTVSGLFLAIPSALTFLVLVLGFVLMHIQVRLEEAHMRTLHGPAFETYCRRVRRWL